MEEEPEEEEKGEWKEQGKEENDVWARGSGEQREDVGIA